MAADIEGYTTTTEIQGPSNIVKVREWHAYSNPSRVYFQFREPLFVTRDDAQLTADQWSGWIEQVLENAAVTDIAYTQDVTPSGQLQDRFSVFWQTPDGTRDGWVTLPFSQFSPATALAAVFNDIDAGG